MVANGTDRAAGLWLYLSGAWTQIKRNFSLQPIDDTEIKLRNNQWLKGRNAANNADIDIVKVNASNVIEFGGSVTATPAVDSVGESELKSNAVVTSKILDANVTKPKLEDSLLNIYSYTSSQSHTILRNTPLNITFSDVDNSILNITSNVITFKKQGYYRVTLNLGYSLSSGNFTNPTTFTLAASGTATTYYSRLRDAAGSTVTRTGGNGVVLPTSALDIVTSGVNHTLNYTFIANWTPGITNHPTTDFTPILTIIYLGN